MFLKVNIERKKKKGKHTGKGWCLYLLEIKTELNCCKLASLINPSESSVYTLHKHKLSW